MNSLMYVCIPPATSAEVAHLSGGLHFICIQFQTGICVCISVYVRKGMKTRPYNLHEDMAAHR